MKFQDAIDIIDTMPETGFMVSFERVNNGMLLSDHFPDKHAGEPLIKTKVLAWGLANKFAEKTYDKCVNIYVTNADFTPVEGYRDKMIINRKLQTQSDT